MFDFAAPLFWYKLVFMAELVIAEGLATYTLNKKRNFILRLILCLAGVFIIAFIFPILSYSSFYTSLMFLLLFGSTLICLKICYDEPWVNLLFCGIIAYTTQHISYELNNFIVTISGIGSFNVYGNAVLTDFTVFNGIIYGGVYAVVYWVIWAFIEYRIRQQKDFKINNIALLTLSAVIVLADIVLNAIVVHENTAETSKIIVSVFYISNILSCCLALGMQFYMLSNKLLINELETVQTLWHQDKINYELSKENIEIINIKCHDLKHQLRVLRKSEGEIDKETLKEIENAISIYSNIFKTGNDVLDVLLTEKSLYCDKKNIKLNCIIDGTKFDFMTPANIYSLFGNALQNSIEAVNKVAEIDKRLIRLKVVGVGGVISIHLENFFNTKENLEFVNGIPKTTKQDKLYHGYGMKSIQLLCEKLGGGFKAYIEGELFKLDIVIPVKNKQGRENS